MRLDKNITLYSSMLIFGSSRIGDLYSKFKFELYDNNNIKNMNMQQNNFNVLLEPDKMAQRV